MKIQLTGADIASARSQTEHMFASLGAVPLEEQVSPNAQSQRIDPFTVAVGLSSIILTLPSTIDAITNFMDRAKRDKAKTEVDALKRVLVEVKVGCILTTDTGRTLILPKAATDDVVDAILEELISKHTD
ncbi:hypothetical protein K3556_08875 [Aliiroseovarius sp. M344]|uniref:hypothetical protein n=1 Tax=Aliiroseovarius sp. M344 TaxID=2867010 RepID=UPI0021AD5AB9|nr:hypothetical protein [Aliiroseovarius sp. M344]UWQ13088.1 hypothetical protein K3556_08875 [Aliiroseovarius sp. M344]